MMFRVKSNVTNNKQLELGFSQNVLRISVRRKRSLRAQWWFAQMRKAVDSAIEWRPYLPSERKQLQIMPGRRPAAA